MTEAEGRLAGFSLLAKINIITGWSFPVEDKHQDILHDQFTKLLIEKYPLVNQDEFEYAIRNYPVKDWGKNINLNLITEAIAPYLEERYAASIKESQAKEKLTLPAPQDDPMTDEEFIEMNYKTWNTLKNYGIISTKCYGILVKQYKINLTQADKDDMYQLMEKTLRMRMETDRTWFNELNPLYQDRNQERWKTRILNECKKKAVENYFKTI